MSLPIEIVEDPRYSRTGAVHVPAGGGVTTWFAGDIYTIKASAASTNGSLGLVEATVPAGGRPVAHAHTRIGEDYGVEILPETHQNGQ
jgi:hypothetical protein